LWEGQGASQPYAAAAEEPTAERVTVAADRKLRYPRRVIVSQLAKTHRVHSLSEGIAAAT
jgi:hypothetical protein